MKNVRPINRVNEEDVRSDKPDGLSLSTEVILVFAILRLLFSPQRTVPLLFIQDKENDNILQQSHKE